MMTALQILDRVAFCIGYAVIGGAGLALLFVAAVIIKIGLQSDDEKEHDD